MFMMSKQSSNNNNVENYQRTQLPFSTGSLNLTEATAHSSMNSPVVESNIGHSYREGDKPNVIPVVENLSEGALNTDKTLISNKAPSTLPQSMHNARQNLTVHNHVSTASATGGDEIFRDLREQRAPNVTQAIPTESAASENATSNMKSGNARPPHEPHPHRPETFDAAKTDVINFRSDSTTPATPSTAPATNNWTPFQNSEKMQPMPNHGDFSNPPTAPPHFNSIAQYRQAFVEIPTYPPSMLQTRHHAAESSVSAHNDANMMHSEQANTSMPRDQITTNFNGMNRAQQGIGSKPELITQRNHSIPLHVDSRRNSGGYPYAPSYIAGQHNAAASAAEQHLQWRRNASKIVNYNDTNKVKAAPEIIEIDDEADQKEKLIGHFTAAIARQLANSEAPAGLYVSQEMNKQSQEFLNWKEQVINERKRSMVEAIGNDSRKRSAVKRLAPPNAEGHNPTKYGGSAVVTNRSGSANDSQSNRINHRPSQYSHHVPMREVHVIEAMNIALDAAISSDSTEYTKAMSASGRRVDSPMTYLVRQLLGQVEILGDEPAVVLAPLLVRDASNKIRLVINKLIEMIVMKAKKDCEDKIREVESRADALQNKNFASGREKKVQDANHQKSFLAMKAFAEEKCQQLVDRDKQIEYLRRKLEAQELELEDSVIRRNKKSNADVPFEEKNNATMRHLISRLDEGMTTIQRQQKEIQALKATIEKDRNSLQSRRDMIPFLKETFGLHDGALTAPTNDTAQHQEIMFLKAEVEELQTTLTTERRQHENTLKAYMKAAVHALKIQSGEME